MSKPKLTWVELDSKLRANVLQAIKVYVYKYKKLHLDVYILFYNEGLYTAAHKDNMVISNLEDFSTSALTSIADEIGNKY